MARSSPTRAFAVHCAAPHTHRSPYCVRASSFMEAALDYIDRWAGESEECRVIVVEQASGERHCFTIALGDAAPRPC